MTTTNEELAPIYEMGPTGSSAVESSAESDSAGVRTVHGIKWALAYASLISTVLFYSLDGTIVAGIQPSIIDSLGEIDKLAWIGVSVTLRAFAVLPMGKAYGVFNVRLLFLTCVTGFEIGSAICGAAPNMNIMILGRVIQGVTGCGCYSGALTYISMITTKHDRPLYLSGVLAMWGLGSVLGPVIGGAFAQSSATWRWAFYINLVVAALFAPALIFCLPDINPVNYFTFIQKLKAQDWVGTIVFLGSAARLSMAITFGGVSYAFSSGAEITLWTMAGVLLVIFILVTIFHPFVSSKNRLYPIHLMKRMELNILQYTLFVAAGALLITLYYTPLIFRFTRGDEPLMAGVRLLPFICLIVVFGFANGALMPRFGYYMPWYVVGNALILVGSSLMITINSSTSASRIYGYTSLIGAGIGSYISAAFAVVQALIPVSDVNNAVSFMTIGQMLGQITLLSIAGSLYQNIGANKLSNLLPAYTGKEIEQLMMGRDSSLFHTLSLEMQRQVVEQVTLAIRNTFAVEIAASAVGFVGSMFLGRQKLY
ncbi:hypothetical protein BDV12DRAFT_196633 [Aspergillus spectabilis]